MQTLSVSLRNRLGRFTSDQDANVAIEATIILPIMFWAYLTMFSIFDAYRQYTESQKAAYTISDLISRQTTPLDDAFIDSTRELFDTMTRTIDRPSVRVTIVKYDEETDDYTVMWSEARGSFPVLDDQAIADWDDRLPVMPDEENVIVFETMSTYDPPFNTGLENRTISNFVFTRPRYAPQVCWLECAEVT